MSLETAAERVRLLKAGMSGKKIEQLFVNLNGYTLVNCADDNFKAWSEII